MCLYLLKWIPAPAFAGAGIHSQIEIYSSTHPELEKVNTENTVFYPNTNDKDIKEIAELSQRINLVFDNRT